jgi:hypothetical protein
LEKLGPRHDSGRKRKASVRTASGRSEPGTRAEADLTVAVLCRRGAAGWAAGSERLPRCPEAGDCWSHFIISPKPKEERAPQSPAGCS